jgi:hypothetical protein
MSRASSIRRSARRTFLERGAVEIGADDVVGVDSLEAVLAVVAVAGQDAAERPLGGTDVGCSPWFSKPAMVRGPSPRSASMAQLSIRQGPASSAPTSAMGGSAQNSVEQSWPQESSRWGVRS